MAWYVFIPGYRTPIAKSAFEEIHFSMRKELPRKHFFGIVIVGLELRILAVSYFGHGHIDYVHFL